jgi:hypothetical protein
MTPEALKAEIAEKQKALRQLEREEATKKREEAFREMVALGWRHQMSAPRDGSVFLGWNYQYDKRGVNCLRLMWWEPGGWCATDGKDSQYGGYYQMSDGAVDLWFPIPPMPYTLNRTYA